MSFRVVDENDNVNSLLKKVKENTTEASKLRNEIKKLTTLHETHQNSEFIEFENKPIVESQKKKTNSDFEREVSFYLDSYTTLDDNFTTDDLIELLPSEDNYHFKDIIMRLQAESLKNIKEITEIIIQDSTLTKDELNEYKNEITKENKKIDILSKALVKDKTVIQETKEKNEIILVPTKYGNIRVIEELQQIPSEFYPRFAELFNSIIDGSFKNVRAFTNNSYLNGIYEIKGVQARVIFARVGKNAYSILTLFVKKDTYATHYYDSLKLKVSEYRNLHNTIKGKLSDKEFLETNNKNVSDLFNLISPDVSEKQLRKDVPNE